MSASPPGSQSAQNGVVSALAAGPFAAVRAPLPFPRRSGTSLWSWRLVLGSSVAVTAALLGVALVYAPAVPFAWVAILATAVLASAFLMTSDPLVRPNLFALVLGSLGGAVLVAAWLAFDSPGARVLLFPLWTAAGMLVYRGAGAGAPRPMVLWPAVLLLAALLLWANLLCTVDAHPTDGPQRNVFAGWPWPKYVGAVRGNVRPTDQGVAGALWLDYAVMLGIAMLVLWRRSTASLAMWLPRLCALLAAMHLYGGFRLALATDG